MLYNTAVTSATRYAAPDEKTLLPSSTRRRLSWPRRGHRSRVSYTELLPWIFRLRNGDDDREPGTAHRSPVGYGRGGTAYYSRMVDVRGRPSSRKKSSPFKRRSERGRVRTSTRALIFFKFKNHIIIALYCARTPSS